MFVQTAGPKAARGPAAALIVANGIPYKNKS